jgi:hypothetical protein
MSMPRRQLARFSIDRLEQMFDEKRDNPDVLTTLLAELSHRDTRRAKRLNGRVLQALGVLPKTQATRKAEAQPGQSRAGSAPLTVEDHRHVASYLLQDHPEWDDATRAKALEFARHHEFLADLIEQKRSQA